MEEDLPPGLSFRDVLIENPPSFDEPSFQDFIHHRQYQSCNLRPEQCYSLANAHNPPTYAAVGDGSTTATISAFGEIVQFDTFLGKGQSGIFSADQNGVPEPYYVESRASSLKDMSETRASDTGGDAGRYGLRFANSSIFEGPPNQTWIDFRWPRYEWQGNAGASRSTRVESTIQWFVRDNIVLQHCTLRNLSETGHLDLDFSFKGDDGNAINIMDLDHTDRHHGWTRNERRWKFCGLHGYSLVSGRTLYTPKDTHGSSGTTPGTRHDNQHSSRFETGLVAVVISVFLDGKALRWEPQISKPWSVKLGAKQNGDTSQSHNSAQIVTAYKMIYKPFQPASWKDFLIPARYSDVNHFFNGKPIPIHSLFDPLNIKPSQAEPTGNALQGTFKSFWQTSTVIASDTKTQPANIPSEMTVQTAASTPPMEYILFRNLEHILSVCSVQLAPNPNDTDVAVALTCGPMSFHRVTASSSYFALQFLLDVVSLLRNSEGEVVPYFKDLLARIQFVCKSHLIWILGYAKKRSDGIFHANYWVTGEALVEQSESWMPFDSPTDTPFQLIKAINCTRLFHENDSDKMAEIYNICIPWLSSLKNKDERNHFTWTHRGETEMISFRLDDHVWVWKALKAIEELGLWSYRGDTKAMWTNAPENAKEALKRLAKLYMPQKARREILRHFTTENDISQERMLATTRSPRGARFLLHARDTVLFHEFERFLRPETTFSEAWTSLLRAQKHHENQQERGTKPLRLALALLMAIQHNHSTIGTKSRENVIEESLSTLLEASSRSGLFPGRFDEDTGRPSLFQEESDRDSYFHTTFEIPFILLTHANILLRPKGQRLNPSPDSSITEHQHQGDPALAAVQVGLQYVPFQSLPAAATNRISQRWKMQEMKKLMPSARFVDPRSIIDIPDEWMYNSAPFLHEDRSSTDFTDEVAKYLVGSLGFDEFKKLLTSTDPPLNTLFEEWAYSNDPEYRQRALKYLRYKRFFSFRNISKQARNDSKFMELLENITIPIGEGLPMATEDGASRRDSPTEADRPSQHGVASEPESKAEAIFKFLDGRGNHDAIGKFLHDNFELTKCILKYSEIERSKGEFSFFMKDYFIGPPASTTVARYLRHCASLTGGFFSSLLDDIKESLKNKELQGRMVMDNAVTQVRKMRDADESNDNDDWPLDDKDQRAEIIDTGKKQQEDAKSEDARSTVKEPRYLTNAKLWRQLREPRTLLEAKKRLIVLKNADVDTATICVLGSPDVERDALSLCFQRHADFEQYFHDDTSMSLNAWETEFHLSFFQLVPPKTNKGTHKGIPPFEYTKLPGGRNQSICRASVGFRFCGDIFDRYWTCHVVQYLTADGPAREWKYAAQNMTRSKSIQQRKVLELSLFDWMLGALLASTKEVFKCIKDNLGFRDGLLPVLGLKKEQYFSSSEDWQQAQYTFQAIEDHLAHVLSYVDKWDAREKDRGIEQPRWTRRDDWKYGRDLKKLLVSNNSKVKDLRNLIVEIQTVKGNLLSLQDQIRNDISLRGSENTRFFTYVTVVFLPLGFATSCFSMADVPPGALIGKMATTAVIALLLTILALAQAEVIIRTLKEMPHISRNGLHNGLHKLAEMTKPPVKPPATTEKSEPLKDDNMMGPNMV